MDGHDGAAEAIAGFLIDEKLVTPLDPEEGTQ
jgi:hypothetical protein